VVAEHSRPQPVDYKIGAAAAARVQESNTRLGRAEAALGGGLADLNKQLSTRLLTNGENDFGLLSRLKDNTFNSCL